MKRWRDGGGFDDERERARREEAARAPLVVQSLATRGRGRRLVLPLAIGGVVLLLAMATVGRYVTFFAAESQTPAAATPIAWLDETAAPASPTATPDPNTSPGAGPTLVPALEARIVYQPYLLVPGDTIQFVVKLTNTSGRSIALRPCPTYRIYVPGSTFPEPERLLNCAAAPAALLQGESVSFVMEYTIPIDVGAGQQLLVWETTRYLRATDSEGLSIGQPAGSTPS